MIPYDALPREDPASTQIFGALAQLGERYNGIVEVRGSIPLGSTKIAVVEFHPTLPHVSRVFGFLLE